MATKDNQGGVGKDKMRGESQDKVHGEGNYAATRQYNKSTKEFIDAGKVEDAARAAAPANADEEAELKAAEQEGLKRAKEKDVSLKREDSPLPKDEKRGADNQRK